MTGLPIVITVLCILNIGCADNLQSASLSGFETEVSDISFSETAASETEAAKTEIAVDGDASEEEVSAGDVHLFEREDKVSTMFYDLQLESITVTDSIGGMTAESDRAFMILDVTITTDSHEIVLSMYAQEFLMICFHGDSINKEDYEKLYPLAEELEEGQLGESWLVVAGNAKRGKLIYNIPKDAIRTVLLVYDSYVDDNPAEIIYGDGYMMTIPKEDWSREQ